MFDASYVNDQTLDYGSTKSSPLLSRDNLSAQPVTTHKINGENDLQWSQSVKLFIKGRGKIEFLTRATQKPKKGPEAIEIWESENALIMSWLINSIESSINKTYMFLATT